MNGFLPPLTTGTENMPRPVNIGTAWPMGFQRLMVSDNPETIDDRSFPVRKGTLWHDHVRTPDIAVRHRVFGWHLNRTGRLLHLGLTVENLSSVNRIRLVGVKRRIFLTQDSYLQAGICLAEAGISGLLKEAAFQPGFRGRGACPIEIFHVNRGQLVGFLYEFAVVGEGIGPLNYKIRSVAGRIGEDLASITSEPVPLSGPHPRGSWPVSCIAGTTSVYTIGERKSFSISNGITDRLLTASTSHDPVRARDNPGHFGATYRIRIPVFNPDGLVHTIRIQFNPRGGIYGGAVRTGEGAFGIPKLTPAPDSPNVAKVTETVISERFRIMELEVMHAGASSLPLAVHVTTVD